MDEKMNKLIQAEQDKLNYIKEVAGNTEPVKELQKRIDRLRSAVKNREFTSSYEESFINSIKVVQRLIRAL